MIRILAGGVACLSLAGCITNTVNTSANPSFVQSTRTVQSVRNVPPPEGPRPLSDSAPPPSAASPPAVVKPEFRPAICNGTDFDVHIASAGEWFGQSEPMIRGWLPIAPHNCRRLPAFRTAEHYWAARSPTPSGVRNWYGTDLSRCVPYQAFAIPFASGTYCAAGSTQVGFRRANAAGDAIHLRSNH